MLRRLMMAGGGTPPIPPQYLNSLSILPYSVLSLDKKISTASVSLRVRRSSDNAEQDIGFAGDGLDTTALTNFVGAGNGFVRTFYDQTGNGKHGQQADATKQPRIVNASVYDGKLVFDGSNDFLSIANFNPASPYVGLYTMLKQSNAGVYKMMFELGPDGQTTAGGLAFYINNNNVQWVMGAGNNSGGRSTVFSITSMTALAQLTALWNRTLTGLNETKHWRSGTLQSSSAASSGEQLGNFSDLTMFIGIRNGASLAADMWLDTAVFYNADTEAIRTSIEPLI